MKNICLIAGSLLAIGFMSACTNDHETGPSHSVSSEAEKNALEAEQAEQELAKLAELQKQSEPKSSKSGRKPASTGAAKVVKAEAPAKTPAKAPKKKKEATVAKAEAKHEAAPAPKAEVKHEEPKHEVVKAEAPKAETPQETAKKEIAAGETSVFKKKTTVAMNDHASKAVAPHAATASKSVSSVYIVQVGAFRVKDNASKLEEKLKGSGFPVRMKEVNHSKNGLLYVVQFEPTPNKDEADAWRSQVKAKVALDSQLVSRPD